MKKIPVLLFIISLTLNSAFSQTKVTTDYGETLTPAESKQLFSQIDSKKALPRISGEACKCIDSISVSKKDYKQISAEIKTCIDKQVVDYEMSIKILDMLKDTSKNKVINVNVNENSEEYKNYYHDIENFLKDSCSALKQVLEANNKESEHSVSANTAALAEYNKGNSFYQVENFKAALPYFLNAVTMDPNFAFAWDNLGICYRKTNDYDNAIIAYKKSLALDPKGVTPLQNIPVAYEFKKEYDNEIEAYQNMLHIFPDNPEGFYGIGKVYMYYKIDLEKALKNMCKAYNIYTKINSPYRIDAERNIGYIYREMIKVGKEDLFKKILKENNINIGN